MSVTDPAEVPVEQLSTEEMLKQILEAQQAHRAEVNALREEINKSKRPAYTGPTPIKPPEQLYEERIAEIREHTHYCPGCGALSKYIRTCSGKKEAGHPEIEMVPVAELLDEDASQHTPAPNTDDVG